MKRRREHEFRSVRKVYVFNHNRYAVYRNVFSGVANVIGFSSGGVRRIVSKGENFSPIPRR